jgi:hypothetical protein
MNKDITICFRTKTKLKQSLESIARYNRWSLSSTIENILVDYVDRVPSPEMEQERRRSPRKNLMLPAIVARSGEKNDPQLGMITDISEGGLQISLPKASALGLEQDNQNFFLDVTMQLPDQLTPVTIRCIPLRLHKGEDKMEMGVAMTGMDSDGYRRLLAFLRKDA